MKLLIIHLSDIHFNQRYNSLFGKKEELFNSLKNQVRDVEKTIIILSGDIAFSGKQEEYKIADDFFTEIIIKLEEYSKKSVFIVMTPGNHDCDFSINESVRKSVLKDLNESVDDGILNMCLSVQEHFESFSKGFNLTPAFSTSLFKQYHLSEGDDSVIINSYNTAYCSQIKETPGSLFYPIHAIDDSYFKREGALVISFFHHRGNWLRPNNAREFMTHIENTSNIVLCGHEHVSSAKRTHDFDNNHYVSIEGGVLQEDGQDDISGFNTMVVDIKEKKYQFIEYVWQNNQYVTVLREKEWYPLEKEKNNDIDKLYFSKSHSEFLNNIGANFTHPLKTKLSLDDLFVFPNVRRLVVTTKEEEESDRTLNFENVITDLTKSTKTIIIGNEKAGKTTLCKVVINNLHKKGYIPIYVKGRKIKSASLEDFKKEVKQNFTEQYQTYQKREFDQIDIGKIYLIIDNFDRAGLNTKYKNILIKNITKSFENIFIIGNDLFTMQEIFDDESESVYSEYQQYAVLEFGHLLRHKLINKWNTLGRVETIKEEELYKKNDECSKIINSIIGPNFIPAYPIFLLTILQSIEAGTPHDLKESSYGHYYQMLILSSLGKIVKKNDEIDKYYTYLSELSFYFFKKNINEATIDQYEEFHSLHYSLYKTKMDMSETLGILIEASLLERHDSSVSFKYRYVYYFFIAKYFSDNLQDKEIIQFIKKMCRRLYQSQCANIILFLTHHSKDPFILEEISLVAKEQFSDFNEVKFDEDVNVINKLIEGIPDIIIETNKTVEENRIEQLEALDNNSIEDEVKDDNLLLDDDIDAIDLISKLNSAFKTMEILGQALKNHYASIKAIKKEQLVEDTYFLGLRTLDSFYKAFEESNEYVINQINDYFEEKRKKQKHIEIDKYMQQDVGRKIIFSLASNITHQFLKKITSCIGTNKLKEIYPEVLKNNNTNAIKLINFSIKLEYLDGFPLNDLKELKKELGSNVLPYSILRREVVNYIYMYPLSIEKKQQIGEVISLPISAFRRIEATS
ncbi:metallophosphoesterase, partial [Bacteroidales bacterium OttesenSCG-928-M11]|nr:metallophosphoesterase [Bacteroidales bacterium OttesenSCG-928-M11]